ncbi:hypothetical protein [Streptomyces sp. NPDC089799]|uniref:hypothetical protein n=1 Tax=Streptomyces sp. NPDC089799 TaxID=3155066 RepID=UPI00344443D9
MTSNPYRRVTSLKYWLIAASGLGVGLIFLYVSGISWFDQHKGAAAFLNQLGGLIGASVALAVLWELVGRRSFFQEMLEVLHVKNDVDSAGLAAIGTDYSRVIDWEHRLDSAKRLDIFAAWATTWRNTHQTRLTRIANRPDAKIRVCLPDPADQDCVRSLATRFNMTEDRVRSKLNEAIDGYKSLDGPTASGRIEIYLSPVFRAFTAYRVDDTFVVSLYHHKDNRSGTVPSFSCHRGGSLYEFFEEDLEGVLNVSTKLYP